MVNGRRHFVRCSWSIASGSPSYQTQTTDNGLLTKAELTNSYAKLSAQTEFQAIHLAFVSFVVVAAQVQQSVQDQLRDLLVKIELIRRCLVFSLLNGDGNVAQK